METVCSRIRPPLRLMIAITRGRCDRQAMLPPDTHPNSDQDEDCAARYEPIYSF